MGISQVPPVPTPTTKGDIVVGTATGPARLPVGTTANQALLVDSTTTTGLKYGTTSLTTTLRQPTQSTSFTITGFSYTNPNITFTTSVAHNFQVGNSVAVGGILQSGSQNVNSTYTVTAVAATTFTANYGATSPSSYTSGGQATLYYTSGGSPSGGKYFSNGVYFLSDGPNYFYSSDAGVTWLSGQVPTDGERITGADFDGTTYAVSCSTKGVYTSPSLAQGSWTQRTAFGGYFCTGVNWCAGSVNRWVAFGSGTTGVTGASARVETATTATGTWTSQTITGTNGSAAVGLAFDNSNTILIFSNGSGPIVSTSGAASWTVTTSANSWYNLGANQGFAWNDHPYHGWWNSVNSRWYGFGGGQGYIYSQASTSGVPNTYWQRQSTQNYHIGFPWRSSSWNYNGNYMNLLVPDFANGRFFNAKISGGTFNIVTYSATATAIDNTKEFFPITGVSFAPNLFPEMANTGSSSPTTQSARYAMVYGNGKWCILSVGNSQIYAPSWTIAVVE